jgi:hypothetical protein
MRSDVQSAGRYRLHRFPDHGSSDFQNIPREEGSLLDFLLNNSAVSTDH